MKRTHLFFAALILASSFLAQVPQSMKYQGVARNASGTSLNNQNLSVRITIRSGSPTGTAELIETHAVTTNAFGLYNLNIGMGTVVSGAFAAITWSTGLKYIEQEVDFGTGYVNMGVSQLLSVPYALYSANGTPGPAGPTGPAGPAGPTGATGPQGPAGTSGGGWTLTAPAYNPSGQLVVNGTAGSGGPVTSTGAAWLSGGNALTGTSSFGSNSNNHIDIATNNVTRGRFLNTGQLTWGTITPGLATGLITFSTNSTYPDGVIIAVPTGANGSAINAQTLPGNTTNFATIAGLNYGTGTGSAVYGNYIGSSTNTIVSGVQGVYQNSTTASGGIGTVGYNSIGSGYNRTGLLGTYNGNAYGIGVMGLGFGGAWPSSATTDYGVVGWVGNNSNYSGYFNGNHVIANGTKSGSVPTSKGNQLLYTTESPEVWFEDIGGGTLLNGEAEIQLDPLFLETVVIDTQHPMHVFIQMQGESNEVYVTPGTTSFKVKERNSGNSNASFSYRIMAKRIHFQDHRFGNDPVWGPGDTRQYGRYSSPAAIDYSENLIIQERKRKEAKNDSYPSSIIRFDTKLLNTQQTGGR